MDNIETALATETDAHEPIETATSEVDQSETEGETKEPPKEQDDPWPKKAQNALSKRDRQIGRMKAELEFLKAETAKLRESASAPRQDQSSQSNIPKPDDYETYEDYITAKAIYQFKQEQAKATEANKATEQQSRDQAQFQQWVSERENLVSQKADEISKLIPDYIEFIEDNSDTLESLPRHIENAFLEADNGALAAYVLAKEGKLESLSQMSPTRAAAEIARAEDRGAAFLKTKISKAPQPIASARGTASSTTSLDELSPKELLARLKIK